MTDIAERRPIDQVLSGIEIIKLPEGAVPLGAIVLVKYLDQQGRQQWCRRHSEDVRAVESLGALKAFALLEEDDIRHLYRGIDAGDDFDDEDD